MNKSPLKNFPLTFMRLDTNVMSVGYKQIKQSLSLKRSEKKIKSNSKIQILFFMSVIFPITRGHMIVII